MPEKKNRNPGKTILLLCSAVVFLFGLSVLLYPSVNRIWTGCLLHRNAEAFLSFVHTDSYQPNETVKSYFQLVYHDIPNITMFGKYCVHQRQ